VAFTGASAVLARRPGSRSATGDAATYLGRLLGAPQSARLPAR
jgi:hypothetical protein